MSIDLTLDRIQKVLNHLPPYTRPTVHIAGTNGKGSLSAMLTSIFLAAEPPLSVGRFNSPHLVSIYDCITFNNENITPDRYSAARKEVEMVARDYGLQISNFEVLTLSALLAFERAAVDIVVLEVGMGGRLDATNVIPDNVVIASALTAVDLDHQAFLGNTVQEIAFEKASIARPEKPFILGPQAHRDVVQTVQQVVSKANGVLKCALKVSRRSWDESVDGPEPAPLSLRADKFVPPPPEPVQVYLPCFSETISTALPLYGDHQLDNLSTALTVIDTILSGSPADSTFLNRLSPESVSKGVRRVTWPGRLSFHEVAVPFRVDQREQSRTLLVLADGAHNQASAITLADYIRHIVTSSSALGGPLSITYILSLSHSPPKKPQDVLKPLLPPHIPLNLISLQINVAIVNFSPPEGMPWIKPVNSSDISRVVKELVPQATIWLASEGQSLSDALRWTAERTGEYDGLVVVAGSLYLVADFYRNI